MEVQTQQQKVVEYERIKRRRRVNIPEYAGLLVMSRDGLNCYKKAPVIHKKKSPMHAKVANKLWWDFERRTSKKVIGRRRDY